MEAEKGGSLKQMMFNWMSYNIRSIVPDLIFFQAVKK